MDFSLVLTNRNQKIGVFALCVHCYLLLFSTIYSVNFFLSSSAALQIHLQVSWFDRKGNERCTCFPFGFDFIFIDFCNEIGKWCCAKCTPIFVVVVFLIFIAFRYQGWDRVGKVVNVIKSDGASQTLAEFHTKIRIILWEIFAFLNDAFDWSGQTVGPPANIYLSAYCDLWNKGKTLEQVKNTAT